MHTSVLAYCFMQISDCSEQQQLRAQCTSLFVLEPGAGSAEQIKWLCGVLKALEAGVSHLNCLQRDEFRDCVLQGTVIPCPTFMSCCFVYLHPRFAFVMVLSLTNLVRKLSWAKRHVMVFRSLSSA